MTANQGPDPGPAAGGRPASEPEVTPAGPSGPRIWLARLGFGLPFRIAYSPYFHINRQEPLVAAPIAMHPHGVTGLESPRPNFGAAFRLEYPDPPQAAFEHRARLELEPTVPDQLAERQRRTRPLLCPSSTQVRCRTDPDDAEQERHAQPV